MIKPVEAALVLRRVEYSPRRSGQGRAIKPVRRSQRVKEIGLEFVGADTQARIAGFDELPGKTHYLLGNKPDDWHASVSTFERVRVEQLYPKVDLVYYGNQLQLEYDFIVTPGGSPDSIAIRFTGADAVEISDAGDLILRLGQEEVRQPKPCLYQVISGERKEIKGGYRLKDATTVGFVVGDYDPSQTLTIDPLLSYSTFLGGNRDDTAWAIAADANGSVYVAGSTLSAQLATPGAFQTNYRGGELAGDVFVAKFSDTGSNLHYLTYLGGTGDDAALGLAVDADGCAYVTGMTDSPDFPIISGLRTNIGGTPSYGIYPIDGFVAKLGPTGSNLVYSTYLGGNSLDEGIAIAVDTDGNACVTGFTYSTNFPVTNALQTTRAGDRDAFVTKIAANGTALVFSTYLGGTNRDEGEGIAIGPSNLVYVTGWTTSTNFPVTNAFQPWLGGGLDAFLTVLGPGGTNLVNSTYLGGRVNDVAYQIAVDSPGTAYLTGVTDSGYGFAWTRMSALAKSSNAGANWQYIGDGSLGTIVERLAIDPSNSANLYAGTSRGMARSRDGGATWDTTVLADSTISGLAPAIAVGIVRAVAIDTQTPTIVYAGTDEGAFRSLDGGTNWLLMSTGLANLAVQSLAIDPIVTTTIYAGTLGGVFKTTDGANTWFALNSGLGSLSVRSLAINNSNPATLYAATDAGVFRSTNAAVTWSAVNTGITNLLARTLAIDPTNPSTLYVGTQGAIFKTTNDGIEWTTASTGLSPTNTVNLLAIEPKTPATLYAGTANGLFKSTNAGGSWILVTNLISGLTITALAIDPQTPSTLYAGTVRLATATQSGSGYVFVTKFYTNILFSEIFGGEANDTGWDLALDAKGNIFVAGVTASTNFPVGDTGGFLRTTNSGRNDAFVMTLNNDGETLYSGFLGGTNDDYGYAIAADAEGNICIAGETFSANFPTMSAFKPSLDGSRDAFVARIVLEPTLRVAPTGSDAVLKWRDFPPGFILESKTNLTSDTNWVTVTQIPPPIGGWHTLTLGATNDTRFFRLRKP